MGCRRCVRFRDFNVVHESFKIRQELSSAASPGVIVCFILWSHCMAQPLSLGLIVLLIIIPSGPQHPSEAEILKRRTWGGPASDTLDSAPPHPREGGARRDPERPGSRVLRHPASSFWFFPLSSHRHLGPGAWDLSARCLVVLQNCGVVLL